MKEDQNYEDESREDELKRKAKILKEGIHPIEDSKVGLESAKAEIKDLFKEDKKKS